MKKLVIFLSYVLTAAAACCLTLFLFPQDTGYTKLEQLEELINARFIADSNPTAMEDAAAAAMVGSLGDRWSYYIPASEYAAHMEQTANAYVGVGITITRQEEPAGLLIQSVEPGGGAMDAGLLPGDLVISVDGHSTAEMSTTDTRDLVRGEEGTAVEFGILRNGEELHFTLIRKRIETIVAQGTMLPGRIGYITIANFDDRCASETIDAIEALLADGAQSLIFDVRNNPGGYAHELVKVLDYLLPEGDLFRTVDYKGTEHVDKSDAKYLDIPMAVLCNENSYSAAEFFAAAIQEYEAGIVVGTETCGKGYFQNTFQLLDGSAVGLSVGKYFTPKGNSLAGVGIQPDISVPVDEDTFAEIYYGVLEPTEDPQIAAAVHALTGE